ncbi:MAG: hypothetical protein AAF389_15045 [Gemmatimonadota bacterium]
MSRKPRKYSAGKNKTASAPSSRVRVYERPDLPGRVFMTRAWVTTEAGRPVETPLPEGYTWEAARLLADKTATERRLSILSGRTHTGELKSITLGELFERYHKWLDTQDMAEKTVAGKERSRKFWLVSLSPDIEVTSLDSDRVERIAATARRRGGHSTRWDGKRLADLRAVVRWGMNKARLYDLNPLRGLELPEYRPDTEDLYYDARESILLATPHDKVDARVTLAASIICDTGRRISAVLAISAVSDLIVAEDRLYLIFRAEFDKGNRQAVVPVSPDTHLLIAEALENHRVEGSGWLFPEGREDHDDPLDKPYSKENATKALHRAEEVLEIPYIEGRAWHGLKRRHVTTSWELSGGDAALVGDITGNVSAKLLKDTYRRVNRDRSAGQVDGVRERLKADAEAGQKGSVSTRKSTRDLEATS